MTNIDRVLAIAIGTAIVVACGSSSNEAAPSGQAPVPPGCVGSDCDLHNEGTIPPPARGLDCDPDGGSDGGPGTDGGPSSTVPPEPAAPFGGSPFASSTSCRATK